ncbi:4'-phosphopantetheinyl transferase family protein [Chryseolinea lacunae]|uniref:4'-phosphopantetheinyl transferase superfamily protein n=1 Tax=Chryseolinea lacunae TaxID=2801331 RepID=A0ABS1KLM5_9BACT|nr:4'-phosphopantetheinyl transferase superfamily protein [Chryseolinea lacunae]MBL0740369.1 4'-phosphopantetheinyl transferase superfamily protein [Chryseolinea lacunae]
MITAAIFDSRVYSELPRVQTLKEKLHPMLYPETEYAFENELLISLVSRLLLQRLLEKKGISIQKLHIHKGRYGKPLLTSSLEFSIAHAAGVAICLVSDEGAVGVDVELIRSIPVDEYKTSFTHDEWHLIQEDPTPQSFFNLWTRKESLLKLHGFGMQVPLRQVDVLHLTGSIYAEDIIYRGVFVRLDIEDYVCHACVPEKDSIPRIEIVAVEL